MKGKVQVLAESYKHYRFKNDRYKVSADYSEYQKILVVFLKNLFKDVVTSGLEVELPSRMGIFVIEQYNSDKYIAHLKSANKPVLFHDRISEKAFIKEYGYVKDIYHDSSETDGRMWTFRWLKSKGGSFKNKSLYYFKLVRSNIRSSSNTEYSNKSNRLTVHDFYKDEGYKIYRTVCTPVINTRNNSEINTQ